MRSRYPLTDDPQLELCLTGTCDCVGAAQCKFRRCGNCDGCVGDDGKTIEDFVGSGEVHEEDICPDCGGVMKP